MQLCKQTCDLWSTCGAKGTVCGMQIQWNGCYAAGSLLKNVAAASLAANEGRLQSLLFALLLLIKDSPNYKVDLVCCRLGH